MALIKCQECFGQVSDQAPVCPHCGAPSKMIPSVMVVGPKKPSKTAKVLSIIVVLSIGAWVASNSQKISPMENSKVEAQGSPLPRPSSTLLLSNPADQDAFEQVRTSRLGEYEQAPNEIQASSVFNHANAGTNALMATAGPNVKNWVGVISGLRTSHGGTDVHVEIKTLNNAVYATEDDAAAGSKTYRDLSNMQKGMRVFFSGTLLQKRHGGQEWERSATEKGSLKEPEFRVAFTSIGTSAVTTDSEQIATAKENFSPHPASQSDGASPHPSFNCAKAHSPPEVLICSDSELMALDNDLAQIYAQAKAVAIDKKLFANETRRAWNWRQQNCTDNICLISWFADRKKTLEKILDEAQSGAAQAGTAAKT